MNNIEVGTKLYKLNYKPLMYRTSYVVGFDVVEVAKVNKTTFKVKGSDDLYLLSDLYKKGFK